MQKSGLRQIGFCLQPLSGNEFLVSVWLLINFYRHCGIVFPCSVLQIRVTTKVSDVISELTIEVT